VEPGWDANLVAVATSGRFIAMPYTNGAKPYGLGISGWCFVLTTALANEIGRFDETFVPVQYEDTDFFHRAIYDHGVELVNVPSAHVTRASGRQSFQGAPWANRANLLHMANRFRYAWKHNLDPNDVPPFWKTPLRDVEAPVAVPA
jgi:GT2 family glycosyltransferase